MINKVHIDAVPIGLKLVRYVYTRVLLIIVEPWSISITVSGNRMNESHKQ